MRLCFVVDARSPIAQNWIRYFMESGHEVRVISSYPCDPDVLPGTQLKVVPLGFTGLSRIKHDGSISQNGARTKSTNPIRLILAHIRSGRLAFISEFFVDWLVPLDLYRQSRRLHQLITEIQPNLVHAMRIPREGVAAALATPRSIPLIMSVWGNDFTLFASKNFVRRHQTRITLQRADALHSDCYRDQRLAIQWGFSRERPILVSPGSGGVNRDLFKPVSNRESLCRQHQLPSEVPIVINPRGIRSYVQNETFFKAIPIVLKQFPDTIFVATGMRHNSVVKDWIKRNNIPSESIRLFPHMPYQQMAELFQLSDIVLSPSTHDGTPNSLLEAIACGCFPVVGDIESIREWIVHNKNGLLCDPTNAKDMADKIIQAIQDKILRKDAADFNINLIRERGDYQLNMEKACNFYQSTMNSFTQM